MKKIFLKLLPILIIINSIFSAGFVTYLLHVQSSGTKSSIKSETSPVPVASSSATPSPALSQVSVEIKTPDKTFNFIQQITEGEGVCDMLKEAKSKGKITSLTLDDSYLATYKTLLVSEINGYRNYWTFTVDGESPMGCSLSYLKNNDHVVWEFVKGGN